MVLDDLVEGLKLKDKPMAREILRSVSDPRITGVPVSYSMPFVWGVLRHFVPHEDPDGFVDHALKFLRENEQDVDWGNQLGADHEAISIVALVARYIASREQDSKGVS